MTTPTGQISLNDVNVELGKSGTTTIALGNSDVRSLAGVASGAISMNNLRGKSSSVNLSYTFSANTANASLNLSTISGYSAGKSNITVTINSGVYLYATSTGNYGLNITGGTTGDTLTIVNNGYIMGQGGNAGTMTSGSAGGPAINVASIGISSFTVTNTSGYIGGGGGGGAGGWNDTYGGGGGGGAGGGNGGSSPWSGGAGGAGGGVGSTGGNGSMAYVERCCTGGWGGGGGGGGRIMPGTGGAGGSGSELNRYGRGGGSGGGGGRGGKLDYGPAGAGGSAGAAGGNANTSDGSGSGGGGWGASGGSGYYGGGGGGKAVNLGGKSITWTGGAASSSRAYGAVS